MAIDRPSTMEDYIELVNQALFEVDELRSSIEYDEEFMGDALNYVESLENGLKSLYASMKSGTYQFADEDLGFMANVKKAPGIPIPFKTMLRLINQTHRLGLEEAE
ncbi:MAG: general secretion pathway protein GspF [Gammaproteobacteria bacterium]|nr:general secretion pathway protein GspF [Gammaproteobacteria bacterium]